MNDTNEICDIKVNKPCMCVILACLKLQINEEYYLQQNSCASSSKFSLKFTCNSSGAPLTCGFEFQGAVQLRKTSSDNLSVK